MNKQRIKEILINQQSILDIDDDLVDRDIDIEGYIRSKEIIVISGIRRCGKSTLLKMISEISSGSKVFIDFSDIRFTNFTIDDYILLDECILEVIGDVDLFLIDEIQNAPVWERWVNRLHSQGKKVFLTGSNSDLLGSEISTFLTGRNRVIDLTPFTFREFINFSGKRRVDVNSMGTKEKVEILSLFDTYSKKGGFPEVLKQNDVALSRNYFNDIIMKDIVVRFGIREITQMKELSLYMISNIGCRVSYKKLRSVTGIKSLSTVKNFLDHLEESFLFSRIRRFSYSLKKQQAYPYKIYTSDPGFITSTAFGFSEDAGHRLENVVYNHLQRRGDDIYYHLEKRECDFIVKKGNKITDAIQVSKSISEPSTRKREIEGIMEAMKLHGLDHGLLITREERETIETDDLEINVIPAWQWLLE